MSQKINGFNDTNQNNFPRGKTLKLMMELDDTPHLACDRCKLYFEPENIVVVSSEITGDKKAFVCPHCAWVYHNSSKSSKTWE